MGPCCTVENRFLKLWYFLLDILNHFLKLLHNLNEPKGYVKHRNCASIPVHIYLDILSPLYRLHLGFQRRVKSLRSVQEFTWSMSKTGNRKKSKQA